MAVAECELLDAAVKAAADAAAPGEVVLLSPACASFDQFRDYEARGDAFRAAVEAIHEPDDQRQDQGGAALVDAGRSAARTARRSGRWFWEIDKVLLILRRGADLDRPDRGRRRLAGRGAALFGRRRQLRRRSIISTAS